MGDATERAREVVEASGADVLSELLGAGLLDWTTFVEVEASLTAPNAAEVVSEAYRAGLLAGVTVAEVVGVEVGDRTDADVDVLPGGRLRVSMLDAPDA